jgi:hypothetical protein
LPAIEEQVRLEIIHDVMISQVSIMNAPAEHSSHQLAGSCDGRRAGEILVHEFGGDIMGPMEKRPPERMVRESLY